MFLGGHFSDFGEPGEMSPYLAALMGVGENPIEPPEPQVFGDVGEIDLSGLGEGIDLTQGGAAAGEGIGELIGAYLEKRKKRKPVAGEPTTRVVGSGIEYGPEGGLAEGSMLGTASSLASSGYGAS